MAQIYFNKTLVAIAKSLIDERDTEDTIQAFAEINKINAIIETINKTGTYDCFYATKLDEQLRRKYAIIDELDNIQPSMNCSASTSMRQTSISDPLQDRSAMDYFGICYTVLIKKLLSQS